MPKRGLRIALVVCVATCVVAGLAAGVSLAANDPFLGEWKMNPAKSKLVDEMKVASAGGNKYAFDFGADHPETIATDGTDQPGLAGTTLAVTVEGLHAWKVVRKQDGRMLLTANWTLSQDGNTLKDDFTEFGPGGKGSTVNFIYQRTAGTPDSGFAGAWLSTNQTITFELVLKIAPYGGDGLSIVNSTQGQTTDVKFDGKDYPKTGSNVQKGSTASARRVNSRTLEITDRVDGKHVSTHQYEVSADSKTLTMSVRPAGRREPNVFVFERQ